jgi:hypothetical protein
MGLLCVAASEGSVCMAACDPTMVHLCADGAACLAAPGGEGDVCWFGGRTPIRRECLDHLECEPGTVCAMGTCTQACTIGNAAPCETWLDPCLPLGTTPLAGFCGDPPEVDAGAVTTP